MQIQPHLSFANTLIIYAFRFLSFLFVSFSFDLLPYIVKVFLLLPHSFFEKRNAKL